VAHESPQAVVLGELTNQIVEEGTESKEVNQRTTVQIVEESQNPVGEEDKGIQHQPQKDELKDLEMKEDTNEEHKKQHGVGGSRINESSSEVPTEDHHDQAISEGNLIVDEEITKEIHEKEQTIEEDQQRPEQQSTHEEPEEKKASYKDISNPPQHFIKREIQEEQEQIEKTAEVGVQQQAKEEDEPEQDSGEFRGDDREEVEGERSEQPTEPTGKVQQAVEDNIKKESIGEFLDEQANEGVQGEEEKKEKEQTQHEESPVHNDVDHETPEITLLSDPKATLHAQSEDQVQDEDEDGGGNGDTEQPTPKSPAVAFLSLVDFENEKKEEEEKEEEEGYYAKQSSGNNSPVSSPHNERRKNRNKNKKKKNKKLDFT